MPENERSRGLTIDQTLARRAAQTFGQGPPERWFDLDGQRTTRELSEDPDVYRDEAQPNPKRR